MPNISQIIVGFSGRSGSGKTTGAKYLSSAFGFGYLRYSAILQEWHRGDDSRTALQEIGWKVMSGGSQSELNRRLINKIGPLKNYAVDGLRHPVDKESLIRAFSPNFFLIFVESPIEVRWQRQKAKGSTMSFEQFSANDKHPVEGPLQIFRKSADVVIINNGELSEYEASLRHAIRSILAKGASR